MENQSLHAPINSHFFQPLLPGFHSHLTIPVAFFSRHVETLSDRNNTAKLRSDASDTTWLVKVDGLKLTNGWEDFALAHHLQTGDIVVFRHEGEMLFHVTPLGPNFCELEYASSHNMNDIIEDQTNMDASGNSSKEKRVKKNPKRKVKSSSNHSHFVAKVSTWSLKNDRMELPIGFTRSNGLYKMSGKKIVLLNEEGKSWKLSLITNKRDMRAHAKFGWTRFCAANEMSHGHYTFKLVHKSEPLVIRLCRSECRPKQRSESKSSSHHSCFEGSVVHTSLNRDQLFLPRSFVSSNGLDKGCSEIVLMNEQGRRWIMALKHFKSSNLTILRKGWTSFCQANSIEAGDSFKFKLVRTGKKPVLSLCSIETGRDKTPLECSKGIDYTPLFSNPSTGDDSNKSKESEEEENNEDQSISQKCLKTKRRKCRSRCRYSVENMDGDQTNTGTGNSSRKKRQKKNPTKKVESSSDSSGFVANVTASSLNNDRLYLPHSFARSNGLDKMVGEKIVLQNEEGRSWELNMIFSRSCMHTFVRPGWRKFCAANRMSKGQQYTFKLVRNSGPPVIRLCLTKQRPKSESSSNHSYFVGSVSAPSLKTDKLYLPRSFVSSNNLDKGCSEIVLKNEWGRTWNLVFKHYKTNTLLRKGWKSFCQENGLKTGNSFKFRLAGTGGNRVLYFCPTKSSRDKTPLECPEGSDDITSLSLNSSSGDESSESEESDKDSIEDKSISRKSLRIKKRKLSSSGRASSSYSQHRFVILTLTQTAFNTYKLFLPRDFTQVNGMNKTRKITLLGKDGVKRVVDLFHERGERLRLGKGWREYCQAQGVKINESFVLELIWGKEASPMLKFCNKVNST